MDEPRSKMDRKDHLIAALTQQRDEANNRIAQLMADANATIADLMAQIAALRESKKD